MMFKPDNRKIVWHVGLIALVCFAAYFNSFRNGFVLEDFRYIQNNPFVKNWTFFPKIFFYQNAQMGNADLGYYRPLYLLSFLVDHSFWALNAQGYHLTNFLLHVIAAVLVYWLGGLLGLRRRASLLAALLFALHPVQNQCVAYISSRVDSIVAIFLLLSLGLYLKYLRKQSKIRLILLMLSYFAALLSKESSFVFPFVLLAYHYSTGEKIRKAALAGVCTALGVVLILRIFFLHVTSSGLFQPGFWANVSASFQSMAVYSRILILPRNLHLIYLTRDVAHPLFLTIAGFVVSVLFAFIAFGKKGKDGFVPFGTFFFCLFLVPTLNVFTENFLAERFLYLPSVGLFLILGRSIDQLFDSPRHGRWVRGSFVMLCVFYAGINIFQNRIWQDQKKFLANEIRFSSLVLTALSERAYQQIREEKYEEAIQLFDKSLKIRKDPALLNNLAVAYQASGRIGKAIKAYKAAIVLNPRLHVAYINLGNIFYNKKRYVEAEALYLKAISLDPYNYSALNNLAVLYLGLSRFEEAKEYFLRACEADPDQEFIYYNLGIIYYNEGQCDKANMYFKKFRAFGHEVEPEYSFCGAKKHQELNKKERRESR